MSASKLSEVVYLLGRVRIALQFMAVMLPTQSPQAELLVDEVTRLKGELEEELRQEKRH